MPKNKQKKENIKRTGVCVSQLVFKKLDEGKYNMNKLIISLLEEFLSKKQKKS
jgi:hypothetical protein